MSVHTPPIAREGSGEAVPGPAGPPRVAEVLLPLPLSEPYDYAEPSGFVLRPGDIVQAPLGPRSVLGVVVALRDGAGTNRPLKEIEGRLGWLSPATLSFVQWASRYAVDAPGAALALCLRGLRHGHPRLSPRFAPGAAIPSNLSPTRRRVLEMAAATALTRVDLSRAAGVSSSVVAGLIAMGALVEVSAAPDGFAPPDLERQGPRLNASQSAAAAVLAKLVTAGAFATVLLDGVTGSGKTEVYLEAAAEALSADPRAQVLILLPEIALTVAALDRIAERFGAAPAAWHSGVPGPQRRKIWDAVASGEARIVIGARSALFLPFARLSLIIVDEEHDEAYKQDNGFIYQARDFAVARGKIEDAPVILASATPSLESLWNARQGRYQWLRLSDRHGSAQLPQVELLDLRRTPPDAGRWISPPLAHALTDTLAAGRQSLLFLNRRGYAPLVLCRACGEKLKSPNTESWLVEHRYRNRLVCHLTGFSMPKPEACPHCGARDSLVSVGPGVERVEEEVRQLFPQARVAVFSSDTAPDTASAQALIGAMAQGEIDILVATQAAAKGHDFPGLTLVGVVDADVGLRGGDLRAAERTFQLLTQVAGRAGRRAEPGRALIQTWAPDHPVMTSLASQDREAFTDLELAEREAAGLPPFGRLAAVILASSDPERLEAYSRALAAAAPNADGVQVFGPAEAPLALIRGIRRKRFLVRAEKTVDLAAYLAAWRLRVRPPTRVRVTFDVDPYSFL